MTKIKQALVLLTATLMLALVLPACKKDKKNGPSERPGKIAGMGDQPGTPAGDAFNLPAGVSLAWKIKGDDCDSTYEVGSGSLVDVCVALFNSTNADITLVLPAGLVILAESTENQHGIILQETKILLKAGIITRCTLGSYCVNGGKHASSSDDVYSFGPVTNSVLIKELLDLLKGKKVNKEDYKDDYSGYYDAIGVLQDAIWAITDYTGLAKENKDAIAALPNK